ncbi:MULTISPECIES: hypothetical protein [unclassified Microcoleus]|uniref:hypothetical protein n=1 Tax=unclassified Microcoleus TaxID=2642155 RepID=UPI0025EE0CBF|nr:MULTISPECIES: hypothetical protein [unclassified Microcoleus]
MCATPKPDKPAPTDLQRGGFTFTIIGLGYRNRVSEKRSDLAIRNLESNAVSV